MKCLLRWQWTARIREWNVLAKKTYLWRTGFADKTKEEIFATYWIAPKGEEDGLETLEDLLLRHWATLNTPAEDLPGIIVYWAGIVAAEVPIADTSLGFATYDAAATCKKWLVADMRKYLLSAHVEDATRAERKKALKGFIKATLAASLVEYWTINAVEITPLTEIVRLATLPSAEAN